MKIALKRFTLKTGRKVVEPPLPVKLKLKEYNKILSNYYETLLKEKQIENIPQAYRNNHSVKTNAMRHQYATTIHKFDFTHFYDSIPYSLIKPHLEKLKLPLRKDYWIDPETKGLIQGSPASGTLAGLALIPFWVNLKNAIPNAIITQYSDDLSISNTSLSQKQCETLILKILRQQKIPCSINKKKTTTHKNFKKVTGVVINHNHQLTTSRDWYRKTRALLHQLKNNQTTLEQFGYKDLNHFKQVASYHLYIDETRKLKRLFNKYETILNSK